MTIARGPPCRCPWTTGVPQTTSWELLSCVSVPVFYLNCSLSLEYSVSIYWLSKPVFSLGFAHLEHLWTVHTTRGVLKTFTYSTKQFMYFTCYSRIVFKHLYSTSRGVTVQKCCQCARPHEKKIGFEKGKGRRRKDRVKEEQSVQKEKVHSKERDHLRQGI